MNFQQQFAQQLEKIKKADPDYKLFGSSSHKYAFGPKLNESDILTFEKNFDCKLPEPYKIFLTEFGNGGAGPSYGIFSLGKMDHAFTEKIWPEYINPGGPFRFTDAYNNDQMLYEGEPRPTDFKNELEYEQAHEHWYYSVGEDNQDRYYLEHALDGAIPICHHGCAYRSWLVVDEKSPEFGNIWDDLVGDSAGVEPATKFDGSRIDFGEWILDWCEKSLHG